MRRARSVSDADQPAPNPLTSRTKTDIPSGPPKLRLRDHANFSRPRLPDRHSLKSDVFGRRRPLADDFSFGRLPISTPTSPGRRPEAQSLPSSAFPRLTDDEAAAIGAEGTPLQHSRNMSAAVHAVLRDRHGTTPRTALAPLAADALANRPAKTLRRGGNGGAENALPPAFSTTMSARQAAATLETTCRDMKCRVKRLPADEADQPVAAGGIRLKLKVSRPGPRFGQPNQRRIKCYIVICEHDKLRTDIYLRRVQGIGIMPDSAAFATLADDIRWRFQREWPRLVDALYVRVPG